MLHLRIIIACLGKNDICVGYPMKSILSAVAASAALFGAATAAVIDFNSFAAGEIVNTQNPSATISASGGADVAIAFDTSLPDGPFSGGGIGEDEDLQAPFTNVIGGGSLSPGNILVIADDTSDCTTTPGFCDPQDDEVGGTITVEFTDPRGVIFESVNAFDIRDTSGQTFTVNLYDLSDALIGSIIVGNAGINEIVGDNEYINLVNPFAQAVSKLEFVFGSSGGIDDLKYSAVVPVPGALLLMLTGLGLGGFVSRKRKPATA